MSITHITGTSQLDKILSSGKLSVIDFHAEWCGPCHMIAPTFEALAKQYAAVNFLKCDVDHVPDVARRYSVSAMPTFIFLKGSTKVDQVRGANRSGLEDALRRHADADDSRIGVQGVFAGKGETLGGSTSTGTPVDSSLALTGIDPQLKFLLYMLAAYLVWNYFL